MARVDQLEEQPGGALGQRQVADLVHDQQRGPRQQAEPAAQRCVHSWKLVLGYLLMVFVPIVINMLNYTAPVITTEA